MTDVDDQTMETVEPEGVPASGMLGAVGVLFVVVTLIVVGAVQMSTRSIQAAREAVIETATYPALREARANAQAKLLQYAPVEGVSGKYRIPVARAMELIVNEARGESDIPMTDQLKLVR